MHRTSEGTEPIESGHPRWITVQTCRKVLVVVHTITAWNRLADILPIFDSDRRIQLYFTFPDVSNVTGDVERNLAESGAVTLPWDRATKEKFDLALSVHHSGELHRISAPLALLSHGMGYTKISKNQESRIKNQESRIKNQESRIKNQESRIKNVYGLAPEWLVRNGSVPDAVVLSHVHDRERLAASTPEALGAAVVAGDPCYDRMQASHRLRPEYRRALGASPGTAVVTVSSTWGPHSLLGKHPDLISDLVGELDMDDHVVAAIVHPNTWYAHGPLQLRIWMAEALRSGLRLIPPVMGWQQTILASDAVIGDHGAVTGYAAAQGIPTLLAAFPRDEVAAGSAVDALGGIAPALHPLRPLPTQIARAIADYDGVGMSAIAKLATSRPGECSDVLRTTFYRLMELAEPDYPAPVFPYRPTDLVPFREEIQACWVECLPDDTDEQAMRIRRRPADVVTRRRRGSRAADAYLVVHHDHPRRDLRGNADVVIVPNEAGVRPVEALTLAIHRHPACSFAAIETGVEQILLRHRNGTVLEARTPKPICGPMWETIVAAAVHDRYSHRPEACLRTPTTLALLLSGQRIRVHLNRIDSAAS